MNKFYRDEQDKGDFMKGFILRNSLPQLTSPADRGIIRDALSPSQPPPTLGEGVIGEELSGMNKFYRDEGDEGDKDLS